MGGADWKDMFNGVQKNDIDLVNYYLKIGIDVNYQHPEIMTTLLIESIRCGHLTITKLLLENGAIPTKKEDFGNDTPLSVAKSLKNKEAILLLSAYLKINPIELKEKQSFLTKIYAFFRRKSDI